MILLPPEFVPPQVRVERCALSFLKVISWNARGLGACDPRLQRKKRGFQLVRAARRHMDESLALTIYSLIRLSVLTSAW